jgi:hypothetical protein
MAEKKKQIDEIEETEYVAVTSTTEATPSKADEDSSPGPYSGEGAPSLDDPPVRTNKPDTPIAHAMVGGAGAPSEDEPEPNEAAGDVTITDDGEQKTEAANTKQDTKK